MSVIGGDYGFATGAKDSAVQYNANHSSTSNADIFGGIGNSLTGNLDYNRQKELQQLANDFSATQADLAYERNAYEAMLNRDFQSAEAEKQRKWEEGLANSAYQRAIDDMRKAGLNPYLLFSNGANGAATPTGAVARGAQGSAYAAQSARASANKTDGLGTLLRFATSIMNSAVSVANMSQRSAMFMASMDQKKDMFNTPRMVQYFDQDGIFRGGWTGNR